MTSRDLATPPDGDDWLVLTKEVLDLGRAVQWVGREDCGAGVGFVGNVRDHAEGRTGVKAVDYEAYAGQVEPRLAELARTVRSRVPGLGRIVVWHRTGRLEVGEASVVVAVSSPHRAEAFDACRSLIDTLKETLPIWKLEHWDDGTDWSPSAKPLRPVDGGDD